MFEKPETCQGEVKKPMLGWAQEICPGASPRKLGTDSGCEEALACFPNVHLVVCFTGVGMRTEKKEKIKSNKQGAL